MIATNWRIFHYIYMPTFSLPMFQHINLHAEDNVAFRGKWLAQRPQKGFLGYLPVFHMAREDATFLGRCCWPT